MSNILTALTLCVNTHAALPEAGYIPPLLDRFHNAQIFERIPKGLTSEQFLERYTPSIIALFQKDGQIAGTMAALMNEIENNLPQEALQHDVFAIMKRQIIDDLNGSETDLGGIDVVRGYVERAAMHERNFRQLSIFMNSNNIAIPQSGGLLFLIDGFGHDTEYLTQILELHGLIKETAFPVPNQRGRNAQAVPSAI